LGCPPVVFNNVDANAWNCLKQKGTDYATTHSYPLPALNDAGSINHMGFAAQWAYDPAAKTLTITCTQHPFLIGCGTINGQIQSGIASTKCIPAS